MSDAEDKGYETPTDSYAEPFSLTPVQSPLKYKEEIRDSLSLHFIDHAVPIIDTIIRYERLDKLKESNDKKYELQELLESACENKKLIQYVQLNFNISDVKPFLKDILDKIYDETEAFMIEAEKASAHINRQRQLHYDKMMKENAQRRRHKYRNHTTEEEDTTCETGPCVLQLRL